MNMQWPHINGEKVTATLRGFNNWRDDFLIEMSTLLLMIGFIMGTVDILTRGGMSTTLWFSTSWSIVQAIAIDGLFFAVWGKVAKTKWQKGNILRSLALLLVGIILAIVAVLVNDILSYQQLTNIADSLTAMNSLHIDSTLFVNVRAILVVLCALLVQLFCRGTITIEHRVSSEVEQIEHQVKQVVIAAQKVKRVFEHQLLTQIEHRVSSEVEQIEHQVKQVVTKHIEQQSPKTPLSIVHAVEALTPFERVEQVLKMYPDCSDRKLGELTGLAPATAKKHRTLIEQPQVEQAV